jgi:cGMP-dependent protein kinase 2
MSLKSLPVHSAHITIRKRLSKLVFEDMQPSATEGSYSAPPLEVLKWILGQAAKDRPLRQLQFLVAFTSTIKFFQTLVKEQGNEAHMQCCQHMTYEFRNAQEVVFYKGDIGSKFYIILEGSCSILVPGQEDGQDTMHEIGTCNKGDSFGELALLKKQPRAATVQCSTDCHFAVLTKADFDRIIGKVKELLLNRKVDFLLSVSLFGNWTKGSMLKASYYFHERSYRRKQVVFAIGDESSEFYFVKEGEFQLLQSMDQSSDTKRSKGLPLKEVAILGSRQILGQEDVLENQRRTYTCVCQSTTAEVLVISKEDFFKRVNNEELQGKLREMQAQKLAFRSKRRETISIVFTDQRIFQSPRESPLLVSSSASAAALALKKYAISRKPPADTPDLTSRIYRPTMSESPLQLLTPSSGLNTTRSPKPATWYFILTQKQKRPLKSSISAASTPKIVNIHTSKMRKKLMSLTLRGLRESATPLPSCDGLMVKSLGEC